MFVYLFVFAVQVLGIRSTFIFLKKALFTFLLDFFFFWLKNSRRQFFSFSSIMTLLCLLVWEVFDKYAVISILAPLDIMYLFSSWLFLWSYQWLFCNLISIYLGIVFFLLFLLTGIHWTWICGYEAGQGKFRLSRSVPRERVLWAQEINLESVKRKVY